MLYDIIYLKKSCHLTAKQLLLTSVNMDVLVYTEYSLELQDYKFLIYQCAF